MKKLTIMFFTGLIVAVLAATASADPGWSKGQRFENRGRYEYQQKYSHRDFRGYHRQPVVVYRVSPRPPERVLLGYEYWPYFSLYLPHFSIQIR